MADYKQNDGKGPRRRNRGVGPEGNDGNLPTRSTSVPVSSSPSASRPARATSSSSNQENDGIGPRRRIRGVGTGANRDNLLTCSAAVPMSSSPSASGPAGATSSRSSQENDGKGPRRRNRGVGPEGNDGNLPTRSTSVPVSSSPSASRPTRATSSSSNQENNGIGLRGQIRGVKVGGSHDNLLARSAAVPVSSSPSVSKPAEASCNSSSLVDMCCPICLSAVKNLAFSCGHMTCTSCAPNLRNCPMCRLEISLRLNCIFDD